MDEGVDYYEFCPECINRGVDLFCSDCTDGDAFEPLSKAEVHPVYRIFPLKEAA